MVKQFIKIENKELKKNKYYIIIAGGRDYNNYELLKESCDKFLQEKSIVNDVVVVSGHASGADKLGERYAKEHGYALELYPADWERYGREAGPIRNAEMAKIADALIAFWDGRSRGTNNMIKKATVKGLEIKVIQYKKCS